MIKKKWQIVINIFGLLLLISGLFFLISFFKDNQYDWRVFVFQIIPIALALGIFKRKDMARRICIGYFLIIGMASILASLCFDYEADVLWKNVISTSLLLVLIILFLSLRQVKECFDP
jgi:hypothetical protein